MVSVVKNVAKGLLYVLIFPLGLVAIALYAVFGLFVFVFQCIRLIYLFFTGRSLQSDLPEDIAAKKILEKDKPKEEGVDPSMSLYPSDSIVYGSGYSSPTLEEKHEDVEEETENEDEVEANEYEEEGESDNV